MILYINLKDNVNVPLFPAIMLLLKDMVCMTIIKKRTLNRKCEKMFKKSLTF